MSTPPLPPIPPYEPLPEPAPLREARQALAIRRAIEDAAPTWIDDNAARWGMPHFLWQRFRDELDTATLSALLRNPECLEGAIVDAWQRWRRRWIAGEWGIASPE